MHALIVDDSKTARYSLRQLLDKQKVSADMVESAEEALDYLHSKPADAPDLIFMDHMMPGMDGFEAVKELKSNPATAAIPIVMYTSTQGGMYFGQARALGAADVINKPATAEDLREVLRRLQEQHLVGAAAKPSAAAKPTVTAVVDELPVAVKPPAPVAVDANEDAALYLEADNPARVSRAGYWLAAVLLLPLLYLGYRHLGMAQQLQQLQSQHAAALRTIEWSFNQSTEFPFGEAPFNQARARQLEELLTQLHATGFRGRVVLESHVGVFCLQYELVEGRPPALVRASSNVALTECAELGQGADPRQVSAVQSVEFRRFLQESPLIGDGIEVEVRPRGSESPLQEYSTDLRALEWNRIAQRNQRIQLQLVAEGR